MQYLNHKNNNKETKASHTTDPREENSHTLGRGKEKWYFSIVDVVDVVAVLTDSKDQQTTQKYWNKLKQRLKEGENETVTNCHQLKMQAVNGKMRKTDAADQNNYKAQTVLGQMSYQSYRANDNVDDF